MSARERPVPAQVLDAAIAWQLCLDGGGTAQQQEAFRSWHAADEAHARAWRQLGMLDHRLAAAAGPVRKALLQARQRRQLGRGLAALAMVIAGGWYASQTQTADYWLADQRTATGEIRSLRLADGTEVALNTHSAIDIRFNASERRIVLQSGEIFVKTAHGDNRPFIVQTADGRLRALGTQFLVSREAGGTRLGVVQSAVAARPARAADERVVGQGEQVLMRQGMLGGATHLPAGATGWTHGMLVVDNVRLADLLEQLSHYRVGLLQATPQVSDLRITGSFPLHDIDLALRALQPTLPVRIEQRTHWWVTVKAATE
ncbi:FecR domain-containing protein [Pseudomonas typographi]|uniref:FecR family protein n=1 Tax=Pseudomonas typographi TaxID=2715964 RepID=A0ABR7YVJ1_9PSED|nr:FecR family protein [Pseudomonas typographi]MBD1552193.1 FecR family protein [Pseudomonas typographi]MBD1585165.1 FecR family protein [Pseudomonas typographi]MBD1597212.1 FecR family protein [Pseudomonas typographi]